MTFQKVTLWKMSSTHLSQSIHSFVGRLYACINIARMSGLRKHPIALFSLEIPISTLENAS